MRILTGTELEGPGILKHLLGERHELIFCKDVQDGVERARAQQPDLIICDILFDDSGVFSFLKELRQDHNLRSIPFVCVNLQKSGMPPSLVASFELICNERPDCDFFDACALLEAGHGAEVSARLEQFGQPPGMSTKQSEPCPK